MLPSLEPPQKTPIIKLGVLTWSVVLLLFGYFALFVLVDLPKVIFSVRLLQITIFFPGMTKF